MKQKTRPEDLALFGGAPLFEEALHVNRPHVSDRAGFLSRVEASLDRAWLTNDGPLVRELEDRLSEELGVSHSVLTSSGTSALALAIRALGLGGEVIMPAFTFVSTAHALHWAGIRPVFCEIDPGTWNIDVGHCRSLIGPRTSAVIATHIWGNACAVEALEALCAEAGAALVFDAAHAFGCTHRGAPIGRFGSAEIFSLHATKAFQTAEGGLVTTNDADLAADLRLMRNFGFQSYDSVVSAGANAKMSEFHAAMGLANLDGWPGTVDRAREVHGAYARELADMPGVELLAPDPDEASNFHYCVARIEAERFGLTRDRLVEALHAERVLARRYYYPGVHRSEPYRSQDCGAVRLPETEAAGEAVLVLPGGAGMTPENAAKVAGLLRFVASVAPDIAAAPAGVAGV